MYRALGQFVSRWWPLVVVAWIALAAVLKFTAPAWDDVTRDGDFAYLPSRVSSVKAEAMLDEAFPFGRSRSQVVLIAARSDRKLSADDLRVSDRLALTFQNALGAGRIKAARQVAEQLAEAEKNVNTSQIKKLAARKQELLDGALQALKEALDTDDHFAAALHNRALAYDLLEKPNDAKSDRDAARRLDPSLATLANRTAPLGVEDFPIVSIYTRHTEVLGRKLASKNGKAQLVVLQLANEFTSQANLRLMEQVYDALKKLRYELSDANASGLALEVSGSAAVGSDMLQSVRESLADTEIYTVVLVIGALLMIYRAPFVAVLPLVTIAISISIGMSIVAALTQIDTAFGTQGWSLQIFKTTKIFVVAVLYGSGADFCIFLIARYREEMLRVGDHEQAVTESLANVGDALAASAFTTICGLGLMVIAEYGKFRNSGPVIAMCLTVTLCASLTLAPALLTALGRWTFWPWGIELPEATVKKDPEEESFQGFWQWIAELVLARPGLVLIFGLFLLAPLVVSGAQVEVTYDLVSELDPKAPSRQGTDLLRKHFAVGESGPLILLVRKEGAAFDTDEGLEAIEEVTALLHEVPGVVAVRSLAEPLGDAPRNISLFSKEGRERLIARRHRLTKSLFLAQAPELQSTTSRFELVLNEDPFSPQAMQILKRVEAKLEESQQSGKPLAGSKLALTGTTAGLRDLREVTQSDTTRIEIAVVIGVGIVLLLVLRQVYVSLAMLSAVLLSVYATLALTVFFFQWAYGDTFQGVDWKVPLFLFVLLVAIGQDYNAYLATRVAEEQEIHGPAKGLHKAMVVTGNIISTCGLLMAASFVSMTTASLRGLVELGFALTLGVLLDTFLVRTILLPAAISLVIRREERNEVSPSESQKVAVSVDVES